MVVASKVLPLAAVWTPLKRTKGGLTHCGCERMSGGFVSEGYGCETRTRTRARMMLTISNKVIIIVQQKNRPTHRPLEPW